MALSTVMALLLAVHGSAPLQPLAEQSPYDERSGPAASAPDTATAAQFEPVRPFTVAVNAGGFTSVGDDQTGLAAGASVEWNASPLWGLALRGNYEAPVTARVSSGTITTRIIDAALLGKLTLIGSTTALEVLAGPALSTLTTSTGGFHQNIDQSYADLALVTALRFRQSLVSRLALTADAGLTIRAHEDTFFVGEPAVLRVARARLCVTAGLAWTL